jgi:phosphoribosylglycinamide formyltransferase 2
LVAGDSNQINFGNLENALNQPNTQIRLFGKPEVHGHRRMGVALAQGICVDEARTIARSVMQSIDIKM